MILFNIPILFPRPLTYGLTQPTYVIKRKGSSVAQAGIASFTGSIDEKINHCYHQSRGWADVGHDYDKAERYLNVAKWLEGKRDQRLKAIFGS